MSKELKKELEEIENLISKADEISDFNFFKYQKKYDLYLEIRKRQEKIINQMIMQKLITEEEEKELELLEENADTTIDLPTPKLFKKYEALTTMQAKVIYKHLDDFEYEKEE